MIVKCLIEFQSSEYVVLTGFFACLFVVFMEVKTQSSLLFLLVLFPILFFFKYSIEFQWMNVHSLFSQAFTEEHLFPIFANASNSPMNNFERYFACMQLNL